MSKIMIVEDDRALVTVFEVALIKEGYEIIVARNCAEAIDALNRHEITLVVLDMNLPDGPGTQVLDLIESEPALINIVTIVLTAYTRFINQSNRPSVIHVLNKPVTGSMLTRTVKTALASSI